MGYSNYTTAASAAQAAYNTLDNSNWFDTVTFDDTTNVISCVKDSETVLTLTYTNGRLDWVFGVYSAYATQVISFWVGSFDHMLYFGFNGYGGNMYTLALYKSTNGIMMLTFHNAYGGEVRNCAYDMTASPENTGTEHSIVSSTVYSTCCQICSYYGTTDTVSASDQVYRFATRQTNIPINVMTTIVIGNKTYATDGWILSEATV